MSVQIPRPTPYPEVNSALAHVLANMQATLGDQFVGLYLGGSLALGDFKPQQSDIDFIAVTMDDLPPELIVALRAMHARLAATGDKWAAKLDGSYVPRHILRNWNSNQAPCPFIEGDCFLITRQGSAVLQRHIIREYGVVVAGPHPQTLVDPVDDLPRAVRDMLEEWWRPLLDDPAWVQETQAQPFAILSMCRALYTLEYGELTSKPIAARWAQQTLGKSFDRLIAWALAWSPNQQSDHLAPTADLIRYTLNRYQECYRVV